VDTSDRAGDTLDVDHLEAPFTTRSLPYKRLTDAIRFYCSALHGFVAQEASGAFGMPESVEESYRLMIDALDIAFRNWKKLR
jgi:hypothetical protein